MIEREIDNVLKFPGYRHAREHYDRPTTRAEWQRMRLLGRRWARVSPADTDDSPPYEASAYWAWSSTQNYQPSLKDRLNNYKNGKDLPF